MEQDKLLEEGEVMLEKVRKHWIVYVKDCIIHVFACFLFTGGAVFISSQGAIPILGDDNRAYGAMVFVFFVIIFWTSFFYFWTRNYFDVWYVTDRHIIAVNQKDMFEREESFMKLSKIQDVSFEKNGFLATFLGFGKLKVQTAGREQEFMIENVDDVEAVTHRIMGLRDKAQNHDI